MSALRKILLIALLAVVAAAAALFAFNNPERISVDVGFARLDAVPASVAFAVAFALGWGFGLLSAVIAMVRIAAERRRLRRELRFAEAEVHSLRSLPLNDDAD